MDHTITVTPFDAQALYRAGFQQICNRDDWKGPIDARVPLELAPFYSRAITFMVGAPVNAIEENNTRMVRLTSIGYRAGAAGDH